MTILDRVQVARHAPIALPLRWPIPRTLRFGAGAFLAAAVALPSLAEEAQGLWARPHYQFFPLALAGAVILARRDGGRLGVLEPGRTAVAACFVAVLLMMTTMAVLINSTWLVTVAALVAVPVVAHALGGVSLARRLVPACALAAVAVRLPRHMDRNLVAALQSLASGCASAALDALGVIHVRSGHVLEVPGKRLLVAEACSGASSFFVILAGSLFVVFWLRLAPTRGVAVVITAVSWGLIANVARIVAVVWSYDRARLDLSDGWRHEALGFAALAVVGVLVPSTDALLRGFVTVVHNRVRALRAFRAFRAGGWRPWQMDGPPPWHPHPAPAGEQRPPAVEARRAAVPTQFPPLGRTVLGRWPVVATLAALALFQGVALGFERAAAGSSQPPATFWSAVALPATWGDLRRQAAPAVSEDGFSTPIASYRFGPHQVHVAASGPFSGWHELTGCYIAQGWTIDRRSVVDNRFVAARMTKIAERYGYAVFGLVDAAGDAMHPPDLGNVPRWRWQSWRREHNLVQVFVEGWRPLTAAEQAQIQAFWNAVRGRFESPKLPAGGRITHGR